MTSKAQNPASLFANSSPTSVVQKPHQIVEPIVLDKDKEHGEWICPASVRANRTHNPIRAIVDSIVANTKLGCQREDGKNTISLAVSVSTDRQLCK
jgi:hypothetical protein